MRYRTCDKNCYADVEKCPSSKAYKSWKAFNVIYFEIAFCIKHFSVIQFTYEILMQMTSTLELVQNCAVV